MQPFRQWLHETFGLDPEGNVTDPQRESPPAEPSASQTAALVADLEQRAQAAEIAQLAATSTEDAYYHAGQRIAYRHAAQLLATLI